jgi:hypothetical protein
MTFPNFSDAMFKLRVPKSMQALPGRIHTSDSVVRDFVKARAERLAHMREYYQRNRVNVRTQQQRKRLAERIEACRDPIVRGILECYHNGQSVETIAAAAGMGVETVRKIIHPRARETA